MFDPPPRDHRYFEAHAEALSEYWSSMSNGQIVAETTVLPPGDQDAYLLEDIADYGPGSGGFWTVALLERLVQDMILVTDDGTLTDGSANLADYDFDNPDTHVIFAHAGADLQSNLVWEPGLEGYSPNDIPTFFVTLGDSAVVDLESIDSTTGEPGRMTECSVIPETTSQDGLVGAITAALVHEFGHALGLPDLYSTTTGLPAVGYWGIMDSGTNLASVVGVEDPENPGEIIAEFVTGLLPPQPTIWSKWYLGLVDEQRVGASSVSTDLAASWRQDTRDKALRIDVSANEFFLVENRWIPPVLDPSWSLTADPQSGVVLYLGEYREVQPGEFELVGNTHLYDFFMPWSGGILIWRVRQDRVEAGMPFNTVQGTTSRLGVELIEADGIKDIGVADFATRGFVGSDTDVFRSATTFVYGDESFTIPGTTTEFGPDTLPASKSSFRIPTGVSVSGIGGTSDVSMPISAKIEGLMEAPGGGYPVEVPGATDPAGHAIVARGEPASLGVVEIGGRTALIATAGLVDGSAGPGLYAWDREGQPFLASARVAEFAGPLAGAPLLADQPVASSLITVTRAGTVSVLDSGNDFASIMQLTLDSVTTQPLLLWADGAPWVFAADRVRSRAFAVELSDADPVPVRFPLPDGVRLQADPVSFRATADEDTVDAVALVYDGQIDLRRARGASVDPDLWPVTLPGVAAPDSQAWLAAWPGATEVEPDRLIVVNERGQVSRVGLVDGEVSVELLSDALAATPVGEVVLADVDGDGTLDIVIATADRLWVLHEGGAPLRGFPVLLSELLMVLESEDDRFVNSPVVADLDGDGLNEIAITTFYGITHVLSDRGASEAGFPRAFSSSGSVLGVVDFAGSSGATRALVSFDALGDSLGSGRRARPARLNALDLGAAPAEPLSSRPAEWVLRGGSMDRSGRGQAGAAAGNSSDPSEGLDTALIIPNPIGSRDSRAFVRYYSGGAHTAKITVYTLEGQEAGHWTHDGGPGTAGVVAARSGIRALSLSSGLPGP
jgi:M6 family metalloprotease-like protein